MEQVIISTSVIISFLVGAGLSWLLFKILHKREIEKIKQFETVQNEIITIKESLYKAEAEKSALKIEMEKRISQAVSSGYEDNATKAIEIADLKKQVAIQEAEYIKQLQKEKLLAFETGCKEALKDYKVVCTPFLKYNDNFFRHTTIGGYSYRLLVKGIPVFEPAEIVLTSRKEFDENVKKMIIETVHTTVSLIGTKLGGLPFEKLPLIEQKL